MKINKIVFLLIGLLMIASCSTKQPSEIKKLDYQISPVASGGTGIDIAANKKSLGIGLQSRLYGSSFNMRDRLPNDKYEQICVTRIAKDVKQFTLVTCLNENSVTNIDINKDDSAYTKKDILKGTEIINIAKGLKLESFYFNLDDDEKTTYTTRKRESYDQQETYSVIRLISNKSVWSGNKMLLIIEN